MTAAILLVPVIIWALSVRWDGDYGDTHAVSMGLMIGAWAGLMGSWPRKRKHRSKLGQVVDGLVEYVFEIDAPEDHQRHHHHRPHKPRPNGLPQENPKQTTKHI